ncbi:hypothetical protein SARC_05434 [Sphaeroforma arctica JP610]|uniref:Uncharacterized protein n=1 Tax=Sphaeroforma arctica JP610 TaxID=667725 RepID=A0A0L0G0A0_9EUKA|nr:hypothetical protein SARC_05434 [Sphaeroforma arctica JP610]KNC82279.1 hypothetical protein SARC_05434 [Sphaeroforma arctica JP610]|eukprot:XP_014156181.1 hypothetical protein SARC_05434 [Sphaeroforma arctica JP610]
MHSEHPMAHETTPASDITQNTLCPTLQAFVRGSALDPSTAIRLAQYTADANPAVVVEHSLQALMRIRLNASERVRLAYCSAQLYSRCPYALHTLCRVALTHYAMRLETVDQADALSVYISRAFACEYYGGLQAADNSYLRQCSNALFSLCVENLRDAMAHSTSDLRSYLVVQILTALSDMPQEVLAALDVPFSFLCDYVSAFGMEPILLCDLTHSQARKECADYYCQ